MSKLKPKIVRDHSGRLCIQLLFGKEAATIALPFDYAAWDEDRQRAFCEHFVQTSSEHFAAIKRANYRNPEKFDACSSLTEPLQDSEAKILPLHQPKSSLNN